MRRFALLLVCASCSAEGSAALELELSFASDALPSPVPSLGWSITVTWPGGQAREQGDYEVGQALSLGRVPEGDERRVTVELFDANRIYYYGKSDHFRLDADTPPVAIVLRSTPTFGPRALTVRGPRELGAPATLSRSGEVTLELDVLRGTFVSVRNDSALPSADDERRVDLLGERDGLRTLTGWLLDPGSCAEGSPCPRTHVVRAVLTDEEGYVSEAAQASIELDDRGFVCDDAGEGGCRRSCGDGVLDGTEQCDDGDAFDDDGCSSACQIESGYSCSGAPSVCGRRFYVQAGAAPFGSGRAWAQAFADLQDALEVSAHGDEIWVAQGTYLPSPDDGAISFVLRDGVAVYGGFAGTESTREQRDPALRETILSGDLDASGSHTDGDSVHVVRCSGVSAATVLDGVTVRGGYAMIGNVEVYGGGMFVVNGSPTLRACRFEDNIAERGGGLYVDGGAPTLTDCVFERNEAIDAGGGLHASSSSLRATRVTFIGNRTSAQNDATSYGGGGAHLVASNAVLESVRFIDNESAALGGGLLLRDHASEASEVLVAGALFNGNRAMQGGGGIAVLHTSARVVAATFAHNCGAFYRNLTTPQVIETCDPDPPRAGAIFADIQSEAGEPVGALTLRGVLAAADTPSELVVTSAVTSVEYSCVAGGAPGQGNLDCAPAWVDADGADDAPGNLDDDLRLQASSMGLDAGDNAALPASLTVDLLGNPRRADAPVADSGRGSAPIVDMGAYERP